MTPSARIASAIEILGLVDSERRPLADILRDWGKSHRFAGSKDRSAIADLVYDALRRRRSAAFLMGAETPRAIMIGMLKLMRGHDVATLKPLFSGEGHGAAKLSEAEIARLTTATLEGAPEFVAGDYPDWLEDHLTEAFGDNRIAELQALATRATLDIRVNLLKAVPEDVLADLAHLHPQETAFSATGLRILPDETGRLPAVSFEPAYLKGLIEIQDEGSQLAALLTGARAGEQVLDLCAGGGGKTLACAALMDNRGQIFATDNDKRRLAPIHERLSRADARNVQVRTPRLRDVTDAIEDLTGHMDLVLIDAPCTGTGTWRRNPDAKWRMRPGALAERVKEQAELLETATDYVKPGGRLAYITCSVLPQENEHQVRAFMNAHPEFSPVSAEEMAAPLTSQRDEFLAATTWCEPGLRLTPLQTGTDGFYVALLKKTR